MTEWNSLILVRDVVEQIIGKFDTKREATDFTRIIHNAMSLYNSSHFETPIDEWKVLDFVEDFNVSNKQFIEIY